MRSNRLLPVFVPGVWGRPGEAFGFLFFARGDETEQIAVGLGAEGFRAVAVVMEKTGGKGAPCALPVFDFEPVERSQGDAVSAIEVAQGFKDFGFELMVRTVAQGFGAPGKPGFGLLGFWLRRWIGAGSFISSHIYLPPQVVWLGRVRCW